MDDVYNERIRFSAGFERTANNGNIYFIFNILYFGYQNFTNKALE